MYNRCTVGGRIDNDVKVELRCNTINTKRDGEGTAFDRHGFRYPRYFTFEKRSYSKVASYMPSIYYLP